MNEQETISIYVLPSEPLKPPRALLFKTPAGEEEPELGPPTGEFEGAMVMWSRDVGSWLTEEGVPVPTGVAEAITEHARNLGVESFLE